MQNIYLTQEENHTGVATPFFWAERSLDGRDVYLVSIRRLPEGGWHATSVDIPGLNIEGETPEEVKREVKVWGPELLTDNHELPHGTSIRFIFDLM